MACGTHRSVTFQPWGGLKQEFAKKPKLKPAVVRIGVKTRWAHSPDFIVANMRKYEVKEKREREVNEFVANIIQERRNEQIRELLSPYQLSTMSHPALTVTQERLLAESIQQRTRKLSSSPVSMDRVLAKKVRHLQQPQKESSEDSRSTSSSRSLTLTLSKTSNSSLKLDQSRDQSSPASEKNLKYSAVSLTESSRSSEINEQTRELSKQYMALMAAVTCTKPPPERIEPARELYLGALREAFANLKSDLKEQSNKILLPEDDIFEESFAFDTSCSWITVEFKELITLPDCLMNSVSDVNRSESAAFLRNAAWDHYFFENSKPGTKFPSPFCKFEEGETPADKFLYPSQQVRNFNTVSCLWTHLTETKVLEHFMKFVIRGNHMEIPPYLMKSGYVHRLLDVSNANLRKVHGKRNSPHDEFVKYQKGTSRCFSHLALVRRERHHHQPKNDDRQKPSSVRGPNL